jgi:DNA-directed RNA polymerase specialized sigma24 family protein
MLQLVTAEDAESLRRRIEALLVEIEEVADAVERLEDDQEQARLSHLLIGEGYALIRSLAEVRQDAVNRLRNLQNWSHRDVSKHLGVPLATAGRIANTKLKRNPDA